MLGGFYVFSPVLGLENAARNSKNHFSHPEPRSRLKKVLPRKKSRKKKLIPFLQTSTLPATLTADRIPRCVRSLLQGGVECTDTSDENIHVESVVYHGQKCNDFEVFTVQIQKFIGSNCDVLMYAVVLFLQKHNKQL